VVSGLARSTNYFVLLRGGRRWRSGLGRVGDMRLDIKINLEPQWNEHN
jgi:hypothetical protein